MVKRKDGGLLVLSEGTGATWTQYAGFVDRLVELGVSFPFDPVTQALPFEIPPDLSAIGSIAAPESRREELRGNPALEAFQKAGGHIAFMRSDPLPLPENCTEPAALDWVSHNAVEHYLTSVRPEMFTHEMGKKLGDRDDAAVARDLLESAHRNNRRYMTYGDFPAVYWYCYLTCHDLGHPECAVIVERQAQELCKDVHTDSPDAAEAVPWTQMGSTPAWLYEITGKAVFREYAQFVAEGFLTKYRLDRGGFYCHDADWTCGEVDEACARSLGKAARVLGRPQYYDLISNHFINSYRCLRDPESGLEFHAGGVWGHTPVIWGRGMGWSLWGLTQALDSLPEDHPRRGDLLAILRSYAEGLEACQAENGIWHNMLLDESSDLESSCTAMFVACLARSLREGWLEGPEFLEVVARGWRGLKSRIWQGWLVGNCTGTAMSLNTHYYWQRPFVRAMPFLALWAAAEVLALRRKAW